jgi:hypothetical protein
VTDLVIADDIICVVFSARFRHNYLVPFGREGKISPLRDDDGKPIILNYPVDIQYVYYNCNNNSLILVGYDEPRPYLKILSVEISSIKAGQSNEYREIYAEEADSRVWDLDIPNCRGVIYNETQRVLKVFDLKEYNQISTIAVERQRNWSFQSRGNMYLMMYFRGRLPYAIRKISFKTYSKQNGEVSEVATIYLHPGFRFNFATLCGNDRICLHQLQRKMQLIDISLDAPEIIQTNIEAEVEPYYLDKLDRFLCYTTNRRLHVCNMRGDILITFEDHQMRTPLLTEPQFYKGNYITSGQDIVISVCGPEESEHFTINISSIITGECLAKITTQGGSQFREFALNYPMVSVAYDERSEEIFTANENGICCLWSKKFHSDDRRLPGFYAEDMRG